MEEWARWYFLCCIVAVIKGIETYVKPRKGPGEGFLMAIADALTAVVAFVSLSAIFIGLWSGSIINGHTLTDTELYAVSILIALVGVRQAMALWNKKWPILNE